MDHEITVGVVAPAYVNLPLWVARQRGFLGGLCELIYAAVRQARIKVWAAMVAAVLVRRPQKV